ncbi:MAG: MFS transporter [Acidimicrobiales bacterium]|nr:MAG: MFS transporter [Acidimicrobiales bacterium]
MPTPVSAEQPVEVRFSGWWVVGAVFLLLAANAGLGFYGLAIYLEAITAEQDLSTTTVSLATSMVFVLAGIAGRVIAPLIERRDVRIVVAIGAFMMAASLALMGRVDSVPSLFGTYAIFAGGFALSGLVPATTLITRWFHSKRSMALSIASTGLSFGGLTFARLASELVDRNGLSSAGPTLGLIYLVTIAIAILAMWPHPRLRGQVPDGALTAPDEAATAEASVDYDRAIRTRFFAIICIGFVFSMSSQVGGIAHIAKLGAERIDRPAGALAVSAVALSSVVFRLLGGWAASRVSMMLMVSLLSALQAVSMVGLAFADSTVSLVIWALVFGGTIGNLLMLQPLIVAEAFGVAAYPRIFAFQQMIVTAGIATGPFIVGWLRDASGYRTAYLIAASLSLVGAALLTQSGSWRPTPATV